MGLKIKKTISLLAVSVLVFVTFSTVMVYAPPPTDGVSPFQNIIVANTDPIPVELQDTINVTVQDPLNVTVNEPIKVINPDGESLNVTLDEPVEVTGETMRGKISTSTVQLNHGTIFDPLEVRESLIGVEGYKVAHVWFSEFSGQVELQILNKMNTFVGSVELEEEVVAPTNTNGVYTVELTGNLLQINLENTAGGTPSFPVYLYVYLLTG